MYRKLDDFLSEYTDLRNSSVKMMQALTDQNINQKIGDDHRTLGNIAWHIVTTIPEMLNRTGLGLASIDPETLPPESATVIMTSYETVSSELLEAVRTNWTDESLLQEDDLYGQPWPRGKTLTALISHEIHHRGQMTVLLRQAGAKVPGVFGPSKEEWANYGMKAPPY